MTLFRLASLIAVILVAGIMLAGCGDGDENGGSVATTPARPGTAQPDGGLSLEAVAGTYDCGIEGESDQPGEVWQLREDGTLTNTPQRAGLEPVEYTWSVEGEQVIIHTGESDDPFTFEGDRLVVAGEPSPEGRWVCTPSS